jgi:hypothetical protein
MGFSLNNSVVPAPRQETWVCWCIFQFLFSLEPELVISTRRTIVLLPDLVRSGPDTFFLEHLYQMLRLPFHLLGQVPDAPSSFPITQGPGMEAIPVSFRQQLGGSLSMAHGKLHQTTITERQK